MAELEFHIFPARGEQDSSKPLLILIHGGAASHRMYRTTIPILNTHGYEVAAPDLPGHGSSVDLGPFTFVTSTKLLAPAIDKIRQEHARKVLVVGVSLGGQAVLDLLQNHPSLVDAAIVSGASIHPPDDRAQWAMPKMPTDQAWLDIIMEDVKVMGGMEKAAPLGQESFSFTFTPNETLPPMLVVVGEEDTAMSIRDLEELTALVKKGNAHSESLVVKEAWHNHPIDIPDRFAAIIEEWAQKVL